MTLACETQFLKLLAHVLSYTFNRVMAFDLSRRMTYWRRQLGLGIVMRDSLSFDVCAST